MKTEKVDVDCIQIPDRLRKFDQDRAKQMMESLSSLGLMTPIGVRFPLDANGDTQAVLVVGRHRLEAARLLGWEQIEVTEFQGGDIESRLWEIAENLHRAELSVQERADHIAEWVRLVDEKLRQVDAVSITPGGRSREGGRRAAAREIGVNEQQVRRAQQVASLSDEAKDEARYLNLDDNQSALLEAAKQPDAESQVAKLRELNNRKKSRSDLRAAGDAIVKDDSADAAATIICDELGQEALDQLLLHLDACGASRVTKAVRRVLLGRHGRTERDVAVFDRTSAGGA